MPAAAEYSGAAAESVTSTDAISIEERMVKYVLRVTECEERDDAVL